MERKSRHHPPRIHEGESVFGAEHEDEVAGSIPILACLPGEAYELIHLNLYSIFLRFHVVPFCASFLYIGKHVFARAPFTGNLEFSGTF